MKHHLLISIVLMTLPSFVSARDPVHLYHGKDPYPLQTIDQPGVPFVSLYDFCSGLGFPMRVDPEGDVMITVNNRTMHLNPQRGTCDLGWKTLPAQIKKVGETPFLRVDHLIQIFSDILGKNMIYEPTSRTIHCPKDEDLRITVRQKQEPSCLRLTLSFSARVEKPKLFQSDTYLVVSIKAPNLTLDTTHFSASEIVESIELFGNLPDGTSEVHIRFGKLVERYTAEPFVSTNSELIIKIFGDLPDLNKEEQIADQLAKSYVGVRRIVIDPGHGGRDIGARGPTGLMEKVVTLDIARKLKRGLERAGPYEVLLTRTGDFALPIKVRTGVANNFHADLFISVHVNAILRPDAWGSETFYLSLEGQTSEEDAYTIDFENREVDEEIPPNPDSEPVDDPPIEDSELDLLLWDLAQAEFIDDSFRVARYIQEQLNVLAGTRNRGVKQASLKVLKGATMPAVLIEVAFISNPDEERKLKDVHFKQRIVRAIVEAVLRYDEDVRKRSEPEKRASYPTMGGRTP